MWCDEGYFDNGHLFKIIYVSWKWIGDKRNKLKSFIYPQ